MLVVRCLMRVNYPTVRCLMRVNDLKFVIFVLMFIIVIFSMIPFLRF